MPNHKPKKPIPIPNPRKYFTEANLRYIWKLEPDNKAAGFDGITSKTFKDNFDVNIRSISEALFKGEYRFRKLLNYRKEKGNGKYRNICVPTIRDRLVQRLILHLLIKPRDKLKVINNISFGVLEGQGTHTALSKAVELRNKYPCVLKTDITAFFDRINRSDLIRLLEKKLKDKKLLPLLKQVVNCEIGIREKNHTKRLKEDGIKIGRGLRQGMPLSPLLSNVFLSEFDKLAIKKSLNIIRYVDDIIVFCNSEEECHIQRKLIENSLRKIKLSIPSLNGASNSKTKIIRLHEPVEFLGIEIYPHENGSYLQRIPERKFEDIRNKLDEYCDYQNVLKDGFTYASLIHNLENKKSGYSASYKDTTNLNDFLHEYIEKIQETKIKLLENVLGADLLASLSDKKRKFLGIE